MSELDDALRRLEQEGISSLDSAIARLNQEDIEAETDPASRLIRETMISPIESVLTEEDLAQRRQISRTGTVGQGRSFIPPSLSARESEALEFETGARARVARERLIEQGIVSGEEGADAFDRLNLSFISDESRRTEFLNETFGAANVKETPAGTILTINGKQTFLDEEGFSLGDLADAAGPTAQIVATIATAVATAPAIVVAGGTAISVAGIALLSNLVGAGVATLGETVAMVNSGEVDLEQFTDIVVDRGLEAGTNALIDFGVGLGLFGGARLLRPVAPTPEGRIAQQGAERFGITSEMTPGTFTGNPALIRTESRQAALPGGSRAQQAQARERTAISQVAEELTPPTSVRETGALVRAEIQTEREAAEQALIGERVAQAETLRGGVEARLEATDIGVEQPITTPFDRRGLTEGQEVRAVEVKQQLDDLLLQAQNNPLNIRQADEGIRLSVEREILAAKSRQSLLESAAGRAIARSPVGDDFANLNNFFETLADIRASVPEFDVTKLNIFRGLETETVDLLSILPASVKRAINLGESIPAGQTFSVAELRNMRSFLDQAATETALGNVKSASFQRILGALTKDIRAAIDNAPTQEIKDTLNAAFDHRIQMAETFDNKTVNSLVREAGQPGARENGKLFVNDLMTGRVDEVNRVINVLGENHPLVSASRGAAVNNLVQTSGTQIGERTLLNPTNLLERLGKMDDAALRNLFGDEATAKEVMNELEILKAARGDIDITQLAEGGIVAPDDLRRLVRNENRFVERFENDFIKPLASGTIEAGAGDVDNIVSYIARSANQSEVSRLLDNLPENIRADVSDSLTVLIMGKARPGSQTLAQERTALGIAKEEDLPTNLLETMETIAGPTANDSLNRLREIMGNEQVDRLLDLGTLTKAATSGRAEIGNAAAALQAGSMLSQVLSSPLVFASDVIKIKALNFLYSLPGFQGWLKSKISIPQDVFSDVALEARQVKVRENIQEALGRGRGAEFTPEITQDAVNSINRLVATSTFIIPDLVSALEHVGIDPNTERGRKALEEFSGQFGVPRSAIDDFLEGITNGR